MSRVQGEGGKARLMGDVADGVDEVASWLSPNPGGVGPMTRALLVTNVVEAAERQAGISANLTGVRGLGACGGRTRTQRRQR